MVDKNEDLPLAGISVLVTRAQEQSAGLIERLESLGAEVFAVPAVAFEAVPEPEGFARVMARVGLYENVVFTSVNGVRFTLGLLPGEDMGPWDLPPALCVGEKTADAWEEAGGTVAAVPERYTADALLEVLGEDLAGRSFLILRPEVVRTDLGREMKKRGAEVDEVVLYRTVTPAEGAGESGGILAEGRIDAVFFASPSAVEGTLKMAGVSPSTGLGTGSQESGVSILDIPVVCIGPTTAAAAEGAGFHEVYFPDEHTAEGMVDELLVIAGGIRKSRVQSPESSV